jgi:hypothetical protein
VRIGDAIKAVALGGLLLGLNLVATTVAITAYALVIAPGRDDAFYQAAAPGIAAWTAPLGGAVLFLAATAWLGRRRPERNPYAFAFRAWIAYAILDLGSGLAMGAIGATFSWLMALSMGLALGGALAGAALARAPHTTAPA